MWLKLEEHRPETRSTSNKEVSWKCVRGQRTTPQGPRSRLIHFLTKTDENHCTQAHRDEGHASSPDAYGSQMLQMATENSSIPFQRGAVLMNSKQGSHNLLVQTWGLTAQRVNGVRFLLQTELQEKKKTGFHRHKMCCYFVIWKEITAQLHSWHIWMRFCYPGRKGIVPLKSVASLNLDSPLSYFKKGEKGEGMKWMWAGVCVCAHVCTNLTVERFLFARQSKSAMLFQVVRDKEIPSLPPLLLARRKCLLDITVQEARERMISLVRSILA